MHTEPNKTIDDLLVKYMLEEASEDENKQVKSWINESSENERYFFHFQLIWEDSRNIAVEQTVDEEGAWKRFRGRVDAREYQFAQTEVMPLHNRWPKVLSIAAILIFIAGASWLMYSNDQKVYQQLTVYSGAESKTDTLPDGSVVTLNKRSSISYPDHFDGLKTRQIVLNGEAFFNVTPDKSKPFVITVNDVTVTVVGTSFNVKSSRIKTEVIVETGLVEVAKKSEKVQVRPRERVTVSDETPKLSAERNEDGFYTYYRTRKLVCNDTPLWKLVEKLNEAYDADIRIERESIRNLLINTTFDQQPLAEILTVISGTFDITIQHKGEQIILK